MINSGDTAFVLICAAMVCFMRVTRDGADSSLQRMIRLVESADASKAKVVGIADRWATWIVLSALTAAIATWIVTGIFLRAGTILVVFCPWHQDSTDKVLLSMTNITAQTIKPFFRITPSFVSNMELNHSLRLLLSGATVTLIRHMA